MTDIRTDLKTIVTINIWNKAKEWNAHRPLSGNRLENEQKRGIMTISLSYRNSHTTVSVYTNARDTPATQHVLLFV